MLELWAQSYLWRLWQADFGGAPPRFGVLLRKEDLGHIPTNRYCEKSHRVLFPRRQQKPSWSWAWVPRHLAYQWRRRLASSTCFVTLTSLAVRRLPSVSSTDNRRHFESLHYNFFAAIASLPNGGGGGRSAREFSLASGRRRVWRLTLFSRHCHCHPSLAFTWRAVSLECPVAQASNAQASSGAPSIQGTSPTGARREPHGGVADCRVHRRPPSEQLYRSRLRSR